MIVAALSDVKLVITLYFLITSFIMLYFRSIVPDKLAFLLSPSDFSTFFTREFFKPVYLETELILLVFESADWLLYRGDSILEPFYDLLPF